MLREALNAKQETNLRPRNCGALFYIKELPYLYLIAFFGGVNRISIIFFILYKEYFLFIVMEVSIN